MNIQFFNFEILEVSQEQKPMPANVRQMSGSQNVRHLNRQELATMSNLDKRLKGSRVGPQTLLDKHEAKKNAQTKQKYKTGAIEEEYEVGQDLGAGQFAVVKRVRHRKTGKFYAAKYIRKRKMKTSRRGVPQEEIEKEIAVLQDLDHPRIVKLRESWNTANEIILVLELVSGGELFDYLAEREQLTENEAAGIIKQVLETISYMHELKIAHFDLKPENVMCLPGNVPAGGAPKIKLVDFGLSQRCDLGIEVTAMHGTPEFVAPEVLAFEPIGLEADLWSIGVITYILLSGCSPFQGDDKAETFQRIAQMDYSFEDEDFAGISQDAKDFIEMLFTRNPLERATAKDCLKSSWIKRFTPEGKAIDIEAEMRVLRREQKELEETVKIHEGQFEKQKEAVQSQERNRQASGDSSAAGLLRKLSEQRKNLQRDVDDFRTQLIGKEGARRRGSLIREPSEVQTQRHYDTSFNINGRTYDVQQTRQTIGSGISRLEQSANTLETHRTDIRRMTRTSQNTMDSLNRSLNSSLTRFSSLGSEVRSRFGSDLSTTAYSSLYSGRKKF
ncbi:unnamed protein product [Oikopleura dioica]|uniref:Protein kinase domain-containing protein n=2 Tax=Oikopleura dioica TaxID=34765 RepID=E4YJ09_OIKDI|nr:unnamed protein product [Oikopleura dioica]